MGNWRKLLLLTVLFGAARGQAEAQHVLYQAYTQEHGLDNLVVTGILEDADHFVWAATNAGFFRYNGSRFQFVGPELGLPEGDLSPVYRSSNGLLWAGSPEGLFFGGSSGFHKAGGVALRLGIGGATQIAELTPTEMLVVAQGHLYSVRSASPDFSTWNVEPFEMRQPGFPASLVVQSIRPAGNALWIGCGTAICRWQQGKLTVYDQHAGVPAQNFYSIVVARDARVWARSASDLMCLERDGHWRNASHDAGLPGLNSRFLALAEDPAGHLMLTVGSKLLIQKAHGWQSIGPAQGLPDVDISTVHIGFDGGLWLGMQGAGLLRLRGFGVWENFTKQEGLSSNTVWQMTGDGAGGLIAATNAGLVHRAAGASQFSVFGSTQKPCVTYGVARDARGEVWSTCGSTISRSNPRGIRSATFSLPDIVMYLESVGDTLWISTLKGLYSVNVRQPGAKPQRYEPLGEQRIGMISPDRAGGIWLAASGGIFHIGATATSPTLVVSSQQHKVGEGVVVGSHQDLWFASSEAGLYRASLDGDKVTHLQRIMRPTIHSRMIYSLHVDRRGWVWCGGDAGMDIFQDHEWKYLNSTTGLIADDPNDGALYEDGDGTLWIGTSLGVSHLLHPTVAMQERMGSVRVLSVTLDGKALPFGSVITVPHGHGMVEVNVGSSLHEGSPDLHLCYHAPGLLNGWERLRENAIRIPQSVPHHIRLEFALRYDDGRMASPVTSIEIDIRPPWWRSTTAIILYVAAFLTLLIFAWRMRVRAMRRREEQLESVVSMRTAELGEKNKALEQAQLRLAYDATHDPLTGLLNRAAVLDALQAWMLDCEGDGAPLMLAILDLDHFKQINDRFGHTAGDAVLVEFAERLGNVLRRDDALGRFGGEEFIFVFPGLEPADAEQRLNEIRTRLSETPFHTESGALHVTASLGYAKLESGDTIATLLKRADEALYRAKREGRDRVCFQP